MRKLSQQIGWSQEAKLYYEWLVQLERLTAILGKNIPIPPPPVVTSLKLKWDNITNVPVANVLSVSDWNTLFDLPTNGVPFTHVFIDLTDPNAIVLANGSNIITPTNLFISNSHIISVEDVGSLITLGGGVFAYSSIQTFSSTSLITLANANFYSCGALTSVTAPLITSAGGNEFSGTRLTSINFPNLLTVGDFCFNDTYYVTSINLPVLTTATGYAFRQCGRYGGVLTTISLPSLTTVTGIYSFQACTSVQIFDFPLLQTITGVNCFNQCTGVNVFNLPSVTNLGGTVLNNAVFNGIVGQTITLTVPAALMTCNGGLPDGDIQYLQANNTVTIITV